MDLNEENPQPVELRISRGFDLASFSPHGISLYIDKGKLTCPFEGAIKWTVANKSLDVLHLGFAARSNWSGWSVSVI